MNQYRIVDRLNSGSFGSVFKTVRLADDAVFVLKRVPLANLDAARRQSSLMEVELMKQLHHPNVVACRDSFFFNQTDLCIVMDYYAGGDLSDVVHTAADSGKPLPEIKIMHWFVQMALALHYLHSHRIVHRDLKTQNVFLHVDTSEIAVGDFGVAEIPDGQQTTGDGSGFGGPTTGTPLYMAPEVLQGHPSTVKSDIWSLGCILYELLCLRHPFQSSDISGLVIKVMRGQYSPIPPMYDGRLGRLIDQLLERDPRRRPQIDDVLMTPVVRSYLASYASIRVPRGGTLASHPHGGERSTTSGLEESILKQQLAAFGVKGNAVSESTATLTLQHNPPVKHQAKKTGHHHPPPMPPPHQNTSSSNISSGVLPGYSLPRGSQGNPQGNQLSPNSPRVDFGSPFAKRPGDNMDQFFDSPPIFDASPAYRGNNVNTSSVDNSGVNTSRMGPNFSMSRLGVPQTGPQYLPQLNDPSSSNAPPRFGGGAPSVSSSSPSRSHNIGNVDDMRYKTLSEIEIEVLKLRKYVQIEMLDPSMQPPAASHNSYTTASTAGPGGYSSQQGNFSPPMVRTQPIVPSRRSNNGHQVSKDGNHQYGSNPQPVTSLSQQFQPNYYVQPSSNQQSVPRTSYQYASSSGGLHHQQHQQQGLYPNNGAEMMLQPTPRLGGGNMQQSTASSNGASPPRADPLSELQYRNKLHQSCVAGLGAKVYGQVYAYYSAVPVHSRDPQRVVNLVQDRSLWSLLPIVEQVVELDCAQQR